MPLLLPIFLIVRMVVATTSWKVDNFDMFIGYFYNERYWWGCFRFPLNKMPLLVYKNSILMGYCIRWWISGTPPHNRSKKRVQIPPGSHKHLTGGYSNQPHTVLHISSTEVFLYHINLPKKQMVH